MRILLHLIFSLLFVKSSSSQTNVFPANGSVGIGTTSPGAPAVVIERNGNNQNSSYAFISIKNTDQTLPAANAFNLAGTSYQAGNGEVLGQIVANYGVGMYAPWSYGSGLYLTTRTNHPIVFTTGVANTERLRISENGGVSIGTTNANGYAFAVNGNSIFTKITVKQVGSWPDYVFEDDYDLMPIPDLKKFVLTNKRLPEMPSASEVNKHGTDIGEIQSLLLKKIEELTMYLIEQNGKIEEQKIEINSLKTELKQYVRN